MARMVIVATALLCFLSAASSVRIDRTDGGYTDIRVSISRDIRFNETIIENIKALFRSSSEFLHKATHGRVYFKEVIIELPDTWPKRASARGLSQSMFHRSDVRVDGPTKLLGDRPFTQQQDVCGRPGDFIQLTPGFLAQIQIWPMRMMLNPAYVFVHEWAHFRYGIFDEYGSLGSSKYPLTYCLDGKIALNACSGRLTFTHRQPKGPSCKIDKECHLVEPCIVTILQPRQQHVNSSVMFMPYMQNMKQFCEGNNGPQRHNARAPNKHNKLCREKSTWEVISEHDDFKGLPRPDKSKRIQVAFQEQQKKVDLGQRVVFVLDTSESMNQRDWMEYTKEALNRYIKFIQAFSLRLAIVTFSDDANVLHQLVPVNADTLQRFLNKIAGLTAKGRACIGCGVLKALEVLKARRENTDGALIILVTASEGSTQPDISAVTPEAEKAKVTVYTMALGESADLDLENLADATNGKGYLTTQGIGNAALTMEMVFVQNTADFVPDIPEVIQIVYEGVVFHRKHERHFSIQSESNETIYVVIQPTRLKKLQVKLKTWLVNPSGRVCRECKETADGAGTSIVIPSPVEEGTWKLHMETKSPAAIDVTIQVKFMYRRGNPIRVTTKVGNLLVDQPSKGIVYANVHKGKQVVLNAGVGAVVSGHDVQGRIHKATVLLHDDGLEPDIDADDGIYSGYFTKFLGKGRYAVEGFVSNGNRTAVLADPLESSASFFSTPNITVIAEPTLEGGASSYPIEDFEVVNTSSEDSNRNRREVSQPLENFQRKQFGGSFAVTKKIVEKNVPPGNIRDLKVAYARPGSNGTLLVQLTWTWPGAHLTEGKASAVTIRASKDYASLKSSFHHQTEISAASVVVGNLNPLPYGARHVVTVALAATFATLRSDGEYVWSAFIAARITNSDGLSSDTSNTAAAWYAPPRAKTRVAVSDKTAAPKTTEVSTTEEVTPAEEGDIPSSNVVLSIGVLILTVVAAAVLLALNAIAVMRRFDVESSTSLGDYHTSANPKQTLETNP